MPNKIRTLTFIVNKTIVVSAKIPPNPTNPSPS